MKRISTTVTVWAEMVKLSHSVFALPFALMAAFLAGRHLEGRTWPYPGQLGLIIVCMIAARSVAMTFNRIVDFQIDARNPRTANRPLPAGRLSVGAAWLMLALAAITFGVGCVGFHVFYANSWPILLSGPVLLYLCGYSLTKRFTKWSHYFLGSALGLSPFASWIAIHPSSVGASTAILCATVLFWVAGFDIIYSCQDMEIDKRDGLYSLPSRIGTAKALWLGRASHIITVACLIALGMVAGLGYLYAAGVAVAALLLLIENALVRSDDFSRVNLSFLTINGIVSLLLSACTIGDVLR